MSLITGTENLAAFFATLVAARNTNAQIRIHVVGDSKVYGTGTNNGYRIDQLLSAASLGYPVSVTYAGYSGENSYLWSHTVAPGFAAQYPDVDLLIIDFGTNEHVATATGGSQTDDQIEANHLYALSTIRAARPISTLSVLFLGQPPANNWVLGQTVSVMQTVNAILKKVAAETNSAFFDTSALFQRPHSEAGWMEQLPVPQYGGGNVHPSDPMNLALVGHLARELFTIPFAIAPGSADAIVYPTLQNGWTQWDSTMTPRCILHDNTVRMNGVIKPGQTTACIPLFTLPSGMIPKANRFFLASSNPQGAPAEIQILSTGVVRPSVQFTGTYISLDQISYRVD